MNFSTYVDDFVLLVPNIGVVVPIRYSLLDRNFSVENYLEPCSGSIGRRLSFSRFLLDWQTVGKEISEMRKERDRTKTKGIELDL